MAYRKERDRWLERFDIWFQSSPYTNEHQWSVSIIGLFLEHMSYQTYQKKGVPSLYSYITLDKILQSHLLPRIQKCSNLERVQLSRVMAGIQARNATSLKAPAPIEDLIRKWALHIRNENADYSELPIINLQQRTAILLMLFTGMRDIDCFRVNLSKSTLEGFDKGSTVRLVLGGACDREIHDSQTKRQKKTKQRGVKASLDFYDIAPGSRMSLSNALNVWSLLRMYIKRTEKHRGSSSILFVNLAHTRTVSPVKANTISKWVSKVFRHFQVKILGIKEQSKEFINITGHDIRAAARYFMQVAGYEEEEIRASIGWLSSSVMQQYYTKRDFKKDKVENSNRQERFEQSLV